jgi:DNA mismatch endonuclease (patch repair protein)
MSDIFSSQKRSQIMSNIKGKETKPEILVRKFLFSNGFRFRKNDSRFPGKPDIVLPKYKIIIFVNGCFWHGHQDCKKSKLPTTNVEFWLKKIEGTKQRDIKNINELKESGWKIITIWECEIKNESSLNQRMEMLVEEIKMVLL